MTLHLPAGPVRLAIDVVTASPRTADGWYPHGVRFVQPDAATIDAISDAIFDGVVPELLHGLRQPPLAVRVVRDAWRAAHRRLAPRAARRPLRLAARIQTGGRTLWVTTRDLSASGTSLVSPVPVAKGTVVSVSLEFPSGRREQRARVIRVRPIQSSGRTSNAWDLGLRFVEGVGVSAAADDEPRMAVA